MAFRKKILCVAVGLALNIGVHAQSTSETLQRVEPITVTAKSAPILDIDNADVGGFGTTLSKTPQSVTVFGSDLLGATATQTLSNVLKLDASLADSYNTTGYIESLTVRGFLLTQENNFRRNGLAISNYGPVAFENKERIEVLKGVAGLQSGVSAPGGLVNYVTKVPLKTAFTTATLGVDEYGGAKMQVDANSTLGTFGVRVNAAVERLRSQFDSVDGSRQFASVALATALTKNTSLSADIEHHKRSQPSVPGQGLLDKNIDGVGESFPDVINPRLNLNNQSWSLPFESTTTTAQIALNHRLSETWTARLSASTQHSRINDRIAFPDGCSNAATYVYPGLCANGDIDIYDFRSEGEKRTVSSWDAYINGQLAIGSIKHALRLGMSGHTIRTDLQPLQAYNYAGSSNIYAPVPVPANPDLLEPNTDSRERTLATYVSVQSNITDTIQSFVGVRASKLNRSSERSDGSRAIAYQQTVTTPWVGIAYSPSRDALVYASWGQGVELDAVPNRASRFVNFGEVLPALKSKQLEIGAKWQLNARFLITGALFSIEKPYADDIVQTDERSLRVADGKLARHRGAEFAATGRINDALSVQASVMLLDAKFTRAIYPALIGERVTNVPRLKTSLFADYKIAALPGFAINTLVTFENGKTVNADGTVALPRAWQIDTGIRYQHQLMGKSTLWRLNIENLTNRIFWREAPTQYWGGVYLFPSTPRTVRASVAMDF
jgi:iron complex outermembrane recepter protein